METMTFRKNGVVIITPEGELDVYTSSQVKEIIDGELGQGRAQMVVNLQKVTYMDSSALGVLVSGLKSARRLNGSLKLACLGKSVDRIFQLTRLTKFFEIYNSEEAALASFKA